MESLALMGAGTAIDVDDLPPNVRGAREGVVEIAVGTRLADAEKELIRRTLDATPTIREAARVLGIGLRTLHTKIGTYGLRRR